ncbi:hypothetical protein RIEGSTA812A_PEG_626 [invertebrate metagenome]|uniref:Uncharacterized protein n=1 Tax=invertebrate metagenome TaxID=1711999 RepID=A0A484H8Q2_9ZZZZ
MVTAVRELCPCTDGSNLQILNMLPSCFITARSAVAPLE